MKTYQALDFDALIARLTEPQRTLILFHRNPDADAVGSAFALCEILEQLGAPARCVCCNEIPERLRFLTDGKQESVLPEAIPENFADARIICVDSASPSQLGSLFDRFGASVSFMIDHHGKGEIYADHYIRPDAAATGEILFDVAEALAKVGKITLTPSLCSLLYAAISSDTGCFRYANVTPATLRCAACLLESGEVDAAMINHCLFESKTVKQVRAEGEAARSLRLYDGGSIGSVVIPYEVKASLELTDQNLETAIDIPRSIQGVEIAFAVRQSTAEGFFRVSMRSNTDFNVSAVCAHFGGGGHHRAAGCGLTASDARDAESQILAVIRALRDQA